jgi:hypothetical protein
MELVVMDLSPDGAGNYKPAIILDKRAGKSHRKPIETPCRSSIRTTTSAPTRNIVVIQDGEEGRNLVSHEILIALPPSTASA